MKKKKTFEIFTLFLIGALFFLPFIAADLSVDSSEWYSPALEFIGLGFDSWEMVVVGMMVILIIAAGLYDILALVGLFEDKYVKLIIAAGLGIIAGLLGLVKTIVVYVAGAAATLGAFAIFLEVGIALVIFIGLSIGGKWASKFSAKREAAKAEAQGEKLAGRIKALKKASGAVGED